MDVGKMLSSLQFQKPDFPLLPKLPPELRAMIWTWALPRPRMVTTSQLTFEQIHQRFGIPNGNFPDLLEFFSDAMTVPCGAFQACRALSPSSATLQPSRSNYEAYLLQLRVRYFMFPCFQDNILFMRYAQKSDAGGLGAVTGRARMARKDLPPCNTLFLLGEGHLEQKEGQICYSILDDVPKVGRH
jgi:hypothetical protein